jgi:ADP-ribose pyrophosphatase YjhB (NUDIX family)
MSQPGEKLKDWKMQSVVQGILTYHEQVLLVGNDYGYRNLVWSLPGGRLEPEESHPQALAREFQEETGLEVVAGEMLYVVNAISSIARQHFVTCVFSAHFATEPEAEPELSCVTDERVREVRFVPFAEVTQLVLPSLGEPLLNYLYHREKLPQRYWHYSEYLRRDWQPLVWPPSTRFQTG